ncbi:TetR family transcriptional regulator [Nocardioides sp. dk4132]|uniref:TetR/AcrR family transcriptional regulator n=1 Tax=unclassified Nocardioides TaxID=2615069 RepID=UPI001294B2EE|nr:MULTISPECIES: TetR/AcrR family transcriptional regulator [unclassified Nocardioides]MQW74395.1 TetR family transcriptional regulator [Nocardioides sp. dk4132]QGA06337.1 TetR family transcriptional regulator [Nocardioides sp. dk884]
MEQRGQVVRRVLSPARAATRERLIEAAIDLATEGGYDAVGIRAVAAHAGVSVPTAYQHVSSKDELLTEALLALGARSTADVRERTPAGRSPADRLTLVFRRILREAAAKPLLYQALYRAYLASAPTLLAIEGQAGFGPEKAAWIGATLRAGDTAGHDEEAIESASRILSMLFLGAMTSVAAGRDAGEAGDVLEDATRRLLP